MTTKHDCNVYMIAVCDECIDKKILQRKLVFVYNGMLGA